MGDGNTGAPAGREAAWASDQSGAERRALLEELEFAYRQMERVLAGTESERHITGDELYQRHAALQVRVSELEEAQQRLRETQRLLLRAERMRAMGQMAAAIVRELDGPLSTIEARVQSLLAGEQDASARSNLDQVRAAVGRLRELAQDALRFSRQRAQQVSRVDLDQLVGQVHRFFGPLARRVALDTALAGGLPMVSVDPSRAEQVLTNFVMNALDAVRDQSDARVCLTTELASLDQLRQREEAAGWHTCLAVDPPCQARVEPWVCAEVRDNGPGIPAEQMGLLFEPFFTTKGEDRGTGLGLAISRTLAAEFGGTILVASKPGAGASFRLLLPEA